MTIEVLFYKTLEFTLKVFTTINSVINLVYYKSGGMLRCLACHVTAMLKLLHEIK